MGQDEAAEGRPRAANASSSDEATVNCGGRLLWVRGRALRLIVWVATHQQQINGVAAERGQMWLTWKGSGPNSIEGNLKVPL